MDSGATVESFVSCFRRAAKLSPGKAFLTTQAGVMTYGEMLDRTARLAGFWAASGLTRGDRVVLATRDDTAAVVMFLSLIRSGLTAVILDPHSPAPEACNLIRASAARGIVLDRELRTDWQPGGDLVTLELQKPAGRTSPLFSKLLGRSQQVPANQDSYPSILQRFAPLDISNEPAPDLVAYIMFTSGTTARPKGVQITHSNLAHHLGTLSRQFGYNSDSRILNVLPLHHTDGMTQGPMVALWNCAAVFRPAPFSIPGIGPLLDSIYSERITHFVTVPTALALILRLGQEYGSSFRTPGFRFVISAAAQLESALWSTFEETFHTRIVNMYGLTESVTGGLFSGPDDDSHRIGTIGKPVDCEARIVDNDGNDVPDGTPGELLMRGGHIMKGYLNNDADTAAVLRDGWFFSGDIATRDHDGFYRIVGRKK
ncbi:MAG: long-chain fatty acid--CoA ligase, partial [bacterium]